MSEPQTVTLVVGAESLTVLFETEMPISEVSKWTGYSAAILRRLDNAGEIAPAHRRGISRFWYAHEVAGIALRRQRKAKKLGKHVIDLPALIRKKRRELVSRSH